jgi:hypothetical protein
MNKVRYCLLTLFVTSEAFIAQLVDTYHDHLPPLQSQVALASVRCAPCGCV